MSTVTKGQKFYLFIVMCWVIFFAFRGVEAQTNIADELNNVSNNPDIVGGSMLPAGAVSCFDYYKFGSVEADLAVVTPNTVSGVPIQFNGVLRNKNPYPIVEGTLFVKIFKTRTTQKDIYGPNVVDQYVALDGVTIPANGSVPVSFTWSVPAYAESGEYELATFFSVDRKFSMLGLSFTDDIIGNAVSFGVTGNEKGPIAIDKESVTVAGDAYAFAAFPPVLSPTEPVEVRAVVRNPHASAEAVTVTWLVYQWDTLLRQNIVQEKTENITVPANGSAPIAITVTDTKYSVYVAQATVIWKDTKSVIGVRFARSGVNQPRIHFPSVMFFPLVAGQENTLFSCLHNAGEKDVVENTRLEVVLTDESGQLIHEIAYEGAVSSAMMAVADSFTPKRSYDRFTLDTRLFKDGKLVDDSRYEYDCKNIDPQSCVGQSGSSASQNGLSTAIGLGGIMLLLIIVSAIARRVLSRREGTVPPAPSY